MQKAPDLQALLRFVRFGLPWDFGTSITIARGGRHPGAFPRAVGSRAGFAGTRRLGPHNYSEGGRRMTRHPRDSHVAREAASASIARSTPGDDSANSGSGVPSSARSGRSLHQPEVRRPAQRSRRDQSAMCGKGNAGNTPASENEGVGEHVRTRFHFDREATREIAETGEPAPHRTKKTCFFCRTAKQNGPTVDLMSRRHPLSSTRTSRRR